MAMSILSPLRRLVLLSAFFAVSAALMAQNFDFTGSRKVREGFVRVTPDCTYSAESGYGYDLVEYAKGMFFSVSLPDGNYTVRLVLGSKKKAGCTTIRTEARRLMLENVVTKKGERKEFAFTVRVNDGRVSATDDTKVEVRGGTMALDWDGKLTFEFNGSVPAVESLSITPAADEVPTLWLCGNSTVVDQEFEPWASWGQMVTRWFDERVCIANYAASGWSVATLIRSKRYQKMLPLIRPNDVVFVEFGHNDQKQKGPGQGAYYHFATGLKQIIDEVRQRGADVVFVTPTQRRSFDENGRIQETHGDYPDAMRWVAQREAVPVIEIHEMTRTFFETLGVEGSKAALVHYPEGTFPGQTAPLADNTHFNDYGAYEVARMLLTGLADLSAEKPTLETVKPETVAAPLGATISSLPSLFRPEWAPFDPAHPDDPKAFNAAWVLTPIYGLEKPAGN